ncbi:WXG100 family type VII secretion target [Streptomyces ziwulingensis]
MASGVEAVTLEGMAKSAGVHLQTGEHVRSSYKRMDGLADQAATGWTGEAGAAFKSALDGWMSNYATVAKILDEMHERMTAHTSKLTSTHESTTQGARAAGALMAEPVGLPGF